MRLFVLCAMLCAPLFCQVASISKSEVLNEKQFWDAKKTVPKLFRAYYVVKEFDAAGVELSTKEVRHGAYAEWSKDGKQKRGCRACTDMPDGVFKLLEFYENGVIERRETFFADGDGPETKEEFNKGVLSSKIVYFAKGGKKSEDKFNASGEPVASSEWRDDGKPLRKEEGGAYGVIARNTYIYHAGGGLKLRRTEVFTWTYDFDSKKASITKTAITEISQTEAGLCTTTVDGMKVSEGKMRTITEKNKTRESKDGEWTYWDSTGKKTKSETWKDGKLTETREFK